MVTEFASGHLNSCGKVQFQQIKKTVTGDNEMKGGGVKMIDIENCIDTLNISKVKRQQDNLSVLSKGSQLNIQILRAVPVLRAVHVVRSEESDKVNNRFWFDVSQSWNRIVNCSAHDDTITQEQLSSTVLWYNENLKKNNKLIFMKAWSEKVIHCWRGVGYG